MAAIRCCGADVDGRLVRLRDRKAQIGSALVSPVSTGVTGPTFAASSGRLWPRTSALIILETGGLIGFEMLID